MTFLHAQSTSEETTVITITNARQTTYEKNDKNKDEENSSEESQDSIVLEGSVEISVQKGSTVSDIKADKVTYDRQSEMLYAEGNVEITTKSSSAGGETTTATSLLMNTATLEGIFDDGRVVQTKSDALNLPSGSTLIVFSDIFGKSEDNTIAFKNSSLTFCDATEPHWHIDASRTWLLPGGEFAFLNALLYVGPVPVLYFPAFYYPKDELIYNPVFGSKPREGKYVQTTVYLKGRKPLSSASSSSSSSSSDSTESATEESLKAVYNFMRPTELKEQERQGLMMHNLDTNYSGDTSTYIKILGDWYSNLGGMVGLDGKLRPSKNYVTNLDFNLLLGFSNTVFLNGTTYSAISSKGYTFYDKSNFMGIKMPFRYGANLDFTLSKPFKLSLALPIYSDPYFYGDFKTRDESMDWISYLIDVSNEDNEDSSTTSSSSQVSNLVWKLNSSYSPNLPSVIKPFLNSISFSLNSSIYINTVQKTSDVLKEDENYIKDPNWASYSPERSFYYPSQITPANATLTLSGTIFQWPLKQVTADTKKVTFPSTLTKPDDLKPQSVLDKEAEEREKQELAAKQTEEAENSDENSDEALQAEKEALAQAEEAEEVEDEKSKLPQPVLPELSGTSASATTISGLTYKLDYNVNSNINTQIAYSTADKDGKTYLKTPEDFEWDKIRSSMYTIKTPVSLTSNLGYGGSFFSMKNSLSYDPLWQDHPNTDGYNDKDRQSLKKADYSAQTRNLTNTNSISIMPFAYIPAFSETGVTWSNTMKIYRRKFIGEADAPEWEENWLDFDDTESITVNSLSFTLGMKELDSKFKQTLTFSSTLKPQVARYTGSLNLIFPYVSLSMSTGIYEKSKDDSTLQYNPFQQSMSINLFDSKLKLSESFSYVYNDNTEQADKHAESLKLSLSYKQLSVSYSSSYTYKYDLYTDKPPEGKKAGYNQRSEKEFVPYSVSLSYSLPSKTYYQWYNRITWAPGLSTNINYDFIKPTNSYFQISPSLTYNINNFFKLTFSATSRNSSIYWYFQDQGKFSNADNADFYGTNFASRMLMDLIQSFGIYGINGWGWEGDAFRRNREASSFKLKSLNMTLTHQLHDWDFNMTCKFEPKIVKVNNEQKYVFDPYFSIGVVWNPMQSIKTNLTHEYKEADDAALWVLK
jgi:lipopolysaccharide assembly outer membrane protein LptD (OstA)